MNTKIVYVITSDNSDLLLEQVYLSLYSLRKYNPDAYVEIVVDGKTNDTLVGLRGNLMASINDKIVIETPEGYDKKQTSRWLKTQLRNIVKGDYLFIDTDTVICDSLADIDTLGYDIAAVPDLHLPIGQCQNRQNLKRNARVYGWSYFDDLLYFNSGVMFVKDNEVTHSFYDCWHENWKNSLKLTGNCLDQPPLALTNESKSYLIKELEGIWNCQISTNGLPYLQQAKIIHYCGYSSKYVSRAFEFYNQSICSNIKEYGMLSKESMNLVRNARSAFSEPCQIAAHEDVDLLWNDLYRLYHIFPKFYSALNFIAHFIICFSRSISRFIKFILR